MQLFMTIILTLLSKKNVAGKNYHYPTGIVKYSDYIKVVEQVQYTANKKSYS